MDIVGSRLLLCWVLIYRLMKYIKRFEMLNILNCEEQELINLPKLSINLVKLNCAFNELTELPTLPKLLKRLDCSCNKLTELPTLPTLPVSLKTLICSNNKLTELSELPDSLLLLDCSGNNLPYDDLDGYNEWVAINHPEIGNSRKFNI